MKQRELKEKMPQTAAFINALCNIFGKDAIHGQIRKGLHGEQAFYAFENGHVIGTRVVTGTLIGWHPVTGLPVELDWHQRLLVK